MYILSNSNLQTAEKHSFENERKMTQLTKASMVLTHKRGGDTTLPRPVNGTTYLRENWLWFCSQRILILSTVIAFVLRIRMFFCII